VPISLDTVPLSPGHLWFLYYLMMVLGALTALSRLGGKIPIGALDRLIRGAVRFRAVVFLLSIPTALTLYPMEFLSADTPLSFIPQPRILAYYFVFAGFGWLLHRQDRLIEDLGKGLWVPLLVALAAFVPLGMVLERVVTKTPFDPPAARWGALYLGALFGWSLVILFLGAFVKWGSHPRPWVSYLSDASYWCYLVHLPIVVAMQILVADLAWPGPLKYAIVMTATIAACLGSYHAFVRTTFIGAALNGRRRPQSLSAAAAMD
jgi:peptidoglycan/LPS O-acetylase OafA/YrhL